jgi:hypothetical protein
MERISSQFTNFHYYYYYYYYHHHYNAQRYVSNGFFLPSVLIHLFIQNSFL